MRKQEVRRELARAEMLGANVEGKFPASVRPLFPVRRSFPPVQIGVNFVARSASIWISSGRISNL